MFSLFFSHSLCIGCVLFCLPSGVSKYPGGVDLGAPSARLDGVEEFEGCARPLLCTCGIGRLHANINNLQSQARRDQQ